MKATYREVVVYTSEEFDAVVKETEAEGLKLAVMSTTGLKAGTRLTFLPEEAFRPKESGEAP